MGGLGACPQAGVSKGIFVRMWLYPAISGYVWLYLAISGYTSLRTTIRSETAQYMLMARHKRGFDVFFRDRLDEIDLVHPVGVGLR